MRVDDAERVIHLVERPDVPGQVGEQHPDGSRGDQSDDDRADPVDVAGRGRDPDQAADHAVDAAQERRLLLRAERHVHDDPRHQRHRGSEVRVDHGRAGVSASEVGVAAVEPVPAKPENASADRDEQQVVGHRPIAIPPESGPHHCCRDEPRHAGGQVNHVAAAEVQRALAGPEAAAPEQERVHRVCERDPQRYEDQPDLELDPAYHAADEQDRRDRSEYELEVNQ